MSESIPRRVAPLTEEEWDEDVRPLLSALAASNDGHVLNIFATLAHHPKLLKRWLVFGSHVLTKSTLPPRERELVILRTGYLWRSEYEWGQHVLIAKDAGITDEEIERVAFGSDAPGWSKQEALLLRATEELRRDARIADDTWSELQGFLDTQGLMDLVFTVGQYTLVSMALRTFGVERDEGVPGFPAAGNR
ncbi:MAG: carboxymuconolactone decarboxylase family protein [Myxococcota bacterium]|nr:carboxymuconolactone decarboxylase family protein [Myxococcota bacterium]